MFARMLVCAVAMSALVGCGAELAYTPFEAHEPVIVTIVTAKHVVAASAGHTFTVMNHEGELIAENISDVDLASVAPDVHRLLNRALAGESRSEGPVIWAGM